MKTRLLALLRRDLYVAARHQSDIVASLFFFVIAASLFPLGIGADPALLKMIAPGVVWVAALLAVMISLGRLFLADFYDGTLEHILLIPLPLPVIVFVKVLANWMMTCLPLIVLAPLIALQFNLGGEGIKTLVLSLLIGTPVLSFIGGIGAALTIGVRGSTTIVAVLILPLFIPVLIFGAGAVTASLTGVDPSPALSLLGALLVVSVVFAPVATAAALRIGLE
jgi:heme exporter protein B